MQCVGPWRIAERAHKPSPVARDEYDVVLEDGTFARIYRQDAHWYMPVSYTHLDVYKRQIGEYLRVKRRGLL